MNPSNPIQSINYLIKSKNIPTLWLLISSLSINKTLISQISSPWISIHPMASMSLREQRDAFVNSMISEGLLDQQQFSQLLMLEEDGSGFLVEVIMLFCDDSERIISELTKLLDQLVVDFQKVDSFVHQLKGSSSSIGAQNIKVACVHFRQSCEEHDKQGCLRALNAVKNEYYHLKAKFNTVVQLCREF